MRNPGFLFTGRGAVSDGTYLAYGFGLILLKALLDSLLVYLSRDVLLAPAAYFSMTFPWPQPGQTEGWLAWTVAVPFLWIALSMTICRLRDAGLCPLFAFFILIPVVNVLMIAALGMTPSAAPPARAQVSPKHNESVLGNAPAILGGCVTTIALCYFGLCSAFFLGWLGPLLALGLLFVLVVFWSSLPSDRAS